MPNRWTAALATIALLAGCANLPRETSGLSALPAVGAVDERFLSYNVEMVELTGGRFWRPYGSIAPDPFEYRPPLDLSDARLRAAAKALAPAYVRYSGTWANATWFADGDDDNAKPPAGFDTVLTRRQWRGAVEFARATGSEIVTSFATSPGARDANGVWQPATAERWLAFTREIGGTIAAAEFANEPNMLWLTKPPAGYGGAEYRRDYARFASWLRKASPDTKLLAPSLAELGEPFRTMSRRNPARKVLEGEELITADSPRPDGFSFHYYSGAAKRCGTIPGFDQSIALAPKWLDSIDVATARARTLRDAVAPGVPLWNTETGETSCGGNPWAATFTDTFRFVDTLGRSARQGVVVFMHNTLAASDYALLDEHGYTPRPSFWAAVLWKRTMGTTVLVAPASPSPDLRLYAHCLVGRDGGVGLAAINLGEAPQTLSLDGSAQLWVLQAPVLDSKAATVNGRQPILADSGAIAGLDPVAVSRQAVIPARSIAFIAAASARNRACR